MTDKPYSAELLIVMSHMGNGGAQRVVANILPHWIDQGVKVTLILANSNATVNWAYKVPDGIDVIECRRWVPKRSILKIAGLINVVGSFFRIRWEIRRARPSVVFSMICPANIKTILACSGLRVPRVVISERNNPARQGFPLHIRIARRLLYRYADVVTANSEGACDWLREIAPKSVVEYLPNPVHVPSVVPPKEHDGIGVRLIYVGRLVPQKRILEVLEVVAYLVNSDYDIMLTVVGSGPDKAFLANMADSLGIEKHVIFVGQVDDVQEYYMKADIFVLLSEYEGMPNALLEAMAWMIAPVVSVEVNETVRIIENGKNGVVVDTRDLDEVARTVRALIDDQPYRQRVAGEARTSVCRYSESDAVREWNRILCLRGHRARDSNGASIRLKGN